MLLKASSRPGVVGRCLVSGPTRNTGQELQTPAPLGPEDGSAGFGQAREDTEMNLHLTAVKTALANPLLPLETSAMTQDYQPFSKAQRVQLGSANTWCGNRLGVVEGLFF